MKIAVQLRIGVADITEDVRRVEVELSDGQKFTLKEIEGKLSIAAAGRLIVSPRAANLVWLEDQG